MTSTVTAQEQEPGLDPREFPNGYAIEGLQRVARIEQVAGDERAARAVETAIRQMLSLQAQIAIACNARNLDAALARARAEGWEAAAKACDEYARKWGTLGMLGGSSLGRVEAAEELAKKFRSLSPPSPAPAPRERPPCDHRAAKGWCVCPEAPHCGTEYVVDLRAAAPPSPAADPGPALARIVQQAKDWRDHGDESFAAAGAAILALAALDAPAPRDETASPEDNDAERRK